MRGKGGEQRGQRGRQGQVRKGHRSLQESRFYRERSRERWEGSEQGSVTSVLYVGNEPEEEGRRQRYSTGRKPPPNARENCRQTGLWQRLKDGQQYVDWRDLDGGLNHTQQGPVVEDRGAGGLYESMSAAPRTGPTTS